MPGILSGPGESSPDSVPPRFYPRSGPFDTVNNANLNVHFEIPIVNNAGRGMPFYYRLGYDSSIWYPGLKA